MARNPPIIVRRVNWLWYAISLPLILVFGYAVLENWIPGYFIVIVMFLAVFWTVSVLFALYAVIRRRGEKRP